VLDGRKQIEFSAAMPELKLTLLFRSKSTIYVASRGKCGKRKLPRERRRTQTSNSSVLCIDQLLCLALQGTQMPDIIAAILTNEEKVPVDDALMSGDMKGVQDIDG
jgi:hypothetical protein